MIYSDLYDFLYPYKKLSLAEIQEKLVHFEASKLEKLIQDLFKYVKHDYFQSHSYFNFYASAPFAGGDFPCSGADCRLQNLDDLARFSSLYADKVLVPSPIDKHYDMLVENKKPDIYELAISIKTLHNLEPLVKANIIGYTSHHLCLCRDCLQKIVKKENEALRNLSLIHDYLTSDFAATVGCRLERDNHNTAYFSFRGGEKFGFHDQVDLMIYEETAEIKKLFSESQSPYIDITSEQIVSLGLADYTIMKITNDLLYAQIYMDPVDSSFLTNRPYDTDVLAAMEGNKREPSENINVLQQLVPLVKGSQITDLVRVRQNEGEAFQVYRDSINQTLKNTRISDARILNDLRRDVIDPEIHQMEVILKNNKKVLAGEALRDIAIIGAGLSIGYFSGLIPLDSMAVAGLIGGLPTLCNIINKLHESRTDSVIKNSKYYFLWKLITMEKSK